MIILPEKNSLFKLRDINRYIDIFFGGMDNWTCKTNSDIPNTNIGMQEGFV